MRNSLSSDELNRLTGEGRTGHAQPEGQVADWQEPIPLDNPDLPELPQSLFPAWCENFINAVAAATETPRELAAGLVIGVIATCTQKKFVVEPKPGYFEPLNLWIATALESGNRKSAVLNLVTTPLLQWQCEQADSMRPKIVAAASKLETARARIEAMRTKAAKKIDASEYEVAAREIAELEAELPPVPKCPQLWTSDVTPERLGVLLAENDEAMTVLTDEGGSIFENIAGRYSGGIPNLDLFLKAHTGSGERVDRGSRGPVHLVAPALSMVLSPQPDLLLGLSNKRDFRGRGFLARFLYLLPRSSLGHRSGDSGPIPESVVADYSAGIRALLRIERLETGPRVIKLSDAARCDWREFSNMVEVELRDGGRFEHCRDWAGKLPGAAGRLAGNLHCAYHAHGNPEEIQVTPKTMDAALTLAKLFGHHALKAFDLMGVPESVKAARKVWAWVSRSAESHFTARDCHQALRSRFPRAADLVPAFEVLVERHYIRRVEPIPGGPGRPLRKYEVHPELVKEWR
jgi:Protein of unknown function (DUF3987)